MSPLLLLTMAAALAGLVPARLVRARWVYRAPRLGVLAWLATARTVFIGVLLAGLTALLHWDATHDLVCLTWRVCLDALTGVHGPPAQAGALVGLVLVNGLLLRLGLARARVWRTTVCQRRRHAAMLRVIGGPSRGEATVIAHPQPAAYLLPGRHARVVVTEGALALLADDELDAVLAHERAHAAGHHHRLLDAASVLHQAFPPLAIFRQAHRQVARLVELCADDAATRVHSRLALARALVAMAAPTQPVGLLHANGGDATERVGRLLEPPLPLPRPVSLAATVGLWALPLVPVVIALLGRLVPVSALSM